METLSARFTYENGILNISVSGSLVINREFQDEMDRNIALYTKGSNAKLLVEIGGFYKIDKQLREEMTRPGVKAPVCAVALVNPDSRWNEINETLLDRQALPFKAKFFIDRNEAIKWLHEFNCQ